ncbi:MAG: aldehyde dehydrogenase family protein [Saprospiraceae bacterium]|nr:aldehyde dehydrogenase family protein [Saprospiraceae bacterium]
MKEEVRKQKVVKGGNGVRRGQKITPEDQSNTNEKRLQVRKTYKIYIGGRFPRTESGRYFNITRKGVGEVNVCRGSRKDFRNAVVEARKAFNGWQQRTAYNRSQIIYRVAEMLEGRADQFVAELQSYGLTLNQSERELSVCIDRIVHYAGWADKYQQIFSTVNPVAAPYFNFSVPEPTGVIAAIAPDEPGLLGLLTLMLPAVVGGNTIILLASETMPTPAISFAEVLHTSDVPGGVVNILTGQRSELLTHFSSHMDVNAIVYGAAESEDLKKIKVLASNNVKRVIPIDFKDWFDIANQNPYLILDMQEIKTTWHPIGK